MLEILNSHFHLSVLFLTAATHLYLLAFRDLLLGLFLFIGFRITLLKLILFGKDNSVIIVIKMCHVEHLSARVSLCSSPHQFFLLLLKHSGISPHYWLFNAIF